MGRNAGGELISYSFINRIRHSIRARWPIPKFQFIRRSTRAASLLISQFNLVRPATPANPMQMSA